MRWRSIACVMIAAQMLTPGATAETLVATRLIRAHEVIRPGDVTPGPDAVPGAARDFALFVGMEARVALYPGRPVRLSDVGPAAVIDRNQIVLLHYQVGALRIATEGRALDRAGPGDRVRVMNLSSRTTVSGLVTADGTVKVGADHTADGGGVTWQ
ncbi:flagellar basal body P-ring formation chaperone FlgA [Roseicitreum antarcticum]|uniref:Flagella basal body P-ring formation protein FlgA n=1 Tax=Roseicitreum antarcticum TaxID=564137 RepID=A0A1H3A280_9RHOB|nr:flagellar basal body P-ring formation chaperone FlgA [Roseicitreum antarcticum]SDX23882.1 flagella basal body P-ring formation protein FlgA [Roseicitreum antarcticum]